MARRYYADYVQYVHMGRWKRARHLDLVCEKLESIIEGKTKRLMIFMPPRHGKSMTVTETFPSFYLGKNPEKRVIEISYSGDLAQQFGKRNRDKVEEFGPALFGHTISQVQATKTNWNLDNGMGGMLMQPTPIMASAFSSFRMAGSSAAHARRKAPSAGRAGTSKQGSPLKMQPSGKRRKSSASHRRASSRLLS